MFDEEAKHVRVSHPGCIMACMAMLIANITENPDMDDRHVYKNEFRGEEDGRDAKVNR